MVTLRKQQLIVLRNIQGVHICVMVFVTIYLASVRGVVGRPRGTRQGCSRELVLGGMELVAMPLRHPLSVGKAVTLPAWCSSAQCASDKDCRQVK
jgi:hypothetical protein